MSPFSRPWRSTAPVAVDALTVTLRDAFRGSPVRVHDGRFLSKSTAKQIVVVGWTGFPSAYQFPTRAMSESMMGESALAVSTTSEQMGLGASVMETTLISCASVARSGTTGEAEAAQMRDLVYENAHVVGRSLGPPWLGGAVMSARMAGAMESLSGLDVVQDW